MISQKMYDVLNQSTREISVRLFLCNQQFKVLGSLEGACIGGNISISSTSDIRRTCKIDMIIRNSSFLIGADKKIWMDKIVQVVLYVKHNRTGEQIPYNMGYYVINQPSVKYSATDKTLSFEGLDLMIRFTDKRNGMLGVTTKITANTPLTSAIKTTVVTLGKYQNVVIEETNRTIPYDIPMSSTNTVYELLSTLRDLFMDCEVFFDENAVFHYQKIHSRINDPVIISFSDSYKHLVLSTDISFDFQNIRNKVVIWGRQLEDGTQITFTKANEDINSPFNINSSIGEIKLVIEDDKIQTLESAETACNYHLFKHNNLCEKLNLEIVPVYFLDANQKIHYENSVIGVSGDFLITDLDIPLNIDGSMKIQCVKQYY